jgi:hypothetical protein
VLGGDPVDAVVVEAGDLRGQAGGALDGAQHACEVSRAGREVRGVARGAGFAAGGRPVRVGPGDAPDP